MRQATHKAEHAAGHASTAARARNGNAPDQAQRTLGNRALCQLMRRRLVQAKLSVSHPDDVYEREAERVADEVMRMPERAPLESGVGAAGPPARIQRLCTEGELQRETLLKNEEPPLHGKLEHTELEEGASGIGPYVDSLCARGEPLAPSTRAFMEPRFGVDFSDVRVHADHDAAAATGAAAATATPAPTGDSLLKEWLAEHAEGHLSSALTWILSQWPTGGRIDDLSQDFHDDVQGLLSFVAATPGASFSIISYARAPDKQHVMHVAQYIRKDWVGYNKYKFSLWPDVVTTGGRAALQALNPEDRKEKLQEIANPEALDVVWDTGTQSSSRTDGTAVAEAYHIGADNPVANGGAAYSWPTGNTSASLHGSGNAVDADPASLPNAVTIRRDQARAWPDASAVQGAFGAANVQQLPATETEAEGFTITGLNKVGHRDAFFDLFFEVQSAARAGFVDLQHFQA